MNSRLGEVPVRCGDDELRRDSGVCVKTDMRTLSMVLQNQRVICMDSMHFLLMKVIGKKKNL